MYKCPSCEKELRWVGDFDFDGDEGFYSYWECPSCHVDVNFNYYSTEDSDKKDESNS